MGDLWLGTLQIDCSWMNLSIAIVGEKEMSCPWFSGNDTICYLVIIVQFLVRACSTECWNFLPEFQWGLELGNSSLAFNNLGCREISQEMILANLSLHSLKQKISVLCSSNLGHISL